MLYGYLPSREREGAVRRGLFSILLKDVLLRASEYFATPVSKDSLQLESLLAPDDHSKMLWGWPVEAKRAAALIDPLESSLSISWAR